MSYIDTNSRSSKSSQADKFQGLGRQPALFGLFIGFVKNVEDVQRNGRLQVWIPDFGSVPEEPQGWITVNYCSPFAGATNVDFVSKADTQSYEGTQTSYGMWMVPPDINNEVLVMFIGGDLAKGVWIGSMYNQFMNHMVPNSATNAKNWQYPGKNIPVAEYNKHTEDITSPDRVFRPYHKTKFNGVGNQGLINDTVRGVTSSSARREAPSQVFGISTPGPATEDSKSYESVKRTGGSSFVMDDARGTEYVQLSTKSGAQIKIDETHGFIYLINRDGTSWVQMDKDGNIDIFGAKDISMRSQRDLNIRADRNINIEAGQNIFVKAAKDTREEKTTFTYDVNGEKTISEIPVWKYVGEGKGDGGNIVTHALTNMHTTVKDTAYLTVVDNDLHVVVGSNLRATTLTGGQDYNSAMGIKISTLASVDIAANTNIRVSSSGNISLASLESVNMCAQGTFSINGDNGVAISSVSKIGISGDTTFDDDVGMRRTLDVDGNASFGNNVSIAASAKIGAGAIISGSASISGGITGGGSATLSGGISANNGAFSVATAANNTTSVNVAGTLNVGASAVITGSIKVGGYVPLTTTAPSYVVSSTGDLVFDTDIPETDIVVDSTGNITYPVDTSGNLRYTQYYIKTDGTPEFNVSVNPDNKPIRNIYATSTFGGGVDINEKVRVATNLEVFKNIVYKGSSSSLATLHSPTEDYTHLQPPTHEVTESPPLVPVTHSPVPPALLPNSPTSAITSSLAVIASIKLPLDKINILATWVDTSSYPEWSPLLAYQVGKIVSYNSQPYIAIKQSQPTSQFSTQNWAVYISEDKFKRKSESFSTIVSRLPTYEPCPEHTSFSLADTSGYIPAISVKESKYEGSGASGTGAPATPPTVEETENIDTVSAENSVVAKAINIEALKCQLKIHEGVKYTVYNDLVAVGRTCAGVGHLLSKEEMITYPFGATVSAAKVDDWLSADCMIAIKYGQILLTTDIWSQLSDIRKRAVADLVYNMGPAKLATFKKFIAAMKSLNFIEAGNELRNSAWFGQVGNRAPKIISMIVNNIDPNGCDKK